MNKLLLSIAVIIFSARCIASESNQVTLHLIGDSTMADKTNLAYPERGWGQLLPNYMNDEIEIVNYATNGRSTRSFIDEGRWDTALSALKEGDYVLIQFGHNDQKSQDPTRYASAEQDYPAFLRRYIADVRAKNATPMIASSICRRHFDGNGKLQRTLLEYAAAARNVAISEGVDFFDLNEQTCGYLSTIGEPASQHLYIQVPADLYESSPEGKIDNTHLNVIGAAKVAQFFARDLRDRKHPLANYVYRDAL